MLSLLSRHLLRQWCDRLVLVALALHAFVVLCAVGGLGLKGIHLPLSIILAAGCDVCIFSLPFTIPFSMAGAYAWALATWHRDGTLARIALAGRDPRLVQWPILVASLITAGLLVPVCHTAAPEARASLRERLSTLPIESGVLGVFLSGERPPIPNTRLAGRPAGDCILDPMLVTTVSDHALVTLRARRAKLADAAAR